MTFRTWLENSMEDSIRSSILDFLGDKLNVDMPDKILDMTINTIRSMNPEAMRELENRGIITTADTSVQDEIRNGAITINELIRRLSGLTPSDSVVSYTNA